MSSISRTRMMPSAALPAAALGGAALVALAVLRLSGGASGGGADGPPGAATVVEVVDGDTLIVDVGGRDEPVRLIGIDTPESVDPDRPDECFGAEASRRLANLVPPGTAVRLVRDIEARDQYDRLLAYVYRAGDGLFVNLAQVADGYAETLAYPPNTTHRAAFAQAQRDARSARAGLWTACGSADVPLG